MKDIQGKIKNKLSTPVFIGSLSVISIILIGYSIYSYVALRSLTTHVNDLSSQVTHLTLDNASTTQALSAAIADTHTSLSVALNAEKQNVGAIAEQLGDFQNKVGDFTGTLNTLQKLSKTDPELLKKYSKVYFLSDTYIPAHLSEIPNAYVYSNTKQFLFQSNALLQLKAMIEAASSTGVKLYVASAYRSFAEQRALKGDYTITYGAGTANSFSADQGYSEHQLGTAVDFTTTGLGGGLDGFDESPAYQWMIANAYRFGFILSYPKNNGYFVFEPWHWRFVGTSLSTYLHEENKNFYELDQRKIDAYLVRIFD
ncbi:MAG: hypothetical protein RIT04_329 [Candidatus Parcubacteria bacterium]|jgi:LAS superfamily LD-carboxypeptidase LdcB